MPRSASEALAELAEPATPQAQRELRPPEKLAIEFIKRASAKRLTSKRSSAETVQPTQSAC